MTAIFQVDAFTDVPFRGNPAAVCPLPAAREEGWMRAVAAEMNLSETAFLWPEGEEGGIRLRWFTPAAEVDLCGHATLAAAHVLWETGRLAPEEPARFATRSGRLTAVRRSMPGGSPAIELDFPALATMPVAAPEGLGEVLGTAPVGCWSSRFDLLVELASAMEVRELRPDLAALARLPVRGLIVTAAADPANPADAAGDADFVSRFFAPAVGVPEDPVTGSAHCVLAPFWATRLGRAELTGCQLSARGGTVGVRVAGDRVALIGRAVTVLRGELVSGASGTGAGR